MKTDYYTLTNKRNINLFEEVFFQVGDKSCTLQRLTI